MNSITARRLRSLIPYLLKAEDNENMLHWTAVCSIWILVIPSFIFLYTSGLHKVNLSQFLELSSISLTLAGTIWISAGVVYTKPRRNFNSMYELQRHTTEVFKSASNHALVGISLIITATLVLLLSKLEHIVRMN
jgi:hypothetical protein